MVTWKHLLSNTKVFGCCNDEHSDYLIIGIPLEISTTYKTGTRFAPNRIREASCNIEFFSLHTWSSLENMCFNDLGDVVISPGDITSSLYNIKTIIEGLLEEFPTSKYFFLGGEHLVTYPIVEGLANHENIDTLVVFDAHTDLRSEYLGSRINHATVFRRLLEKFSFNILYIGARAISLDELSFINENRDNIKLVDPRILYSGQVDLSDILKNYVNGKEIYLSIDMDVFDPSYAPGVSNPEPLGIDPFMFLKTMEYIIEAASKIVGIDIVEVNPLVDVNDITSVLASKIIFEIVALMNRKDSANK
ncbi:MAG: agmatinase [Staphylothermus sp.]|nr:agmatinase [Staphylothermus sp.]